MGKRECKWRNKIEKKLRVTKENRESLGKMEKVQILTKHKIDDNIDTIKTK